MCEQMCPIDDPLVHSFEASAVDPARFHHREHLYVAFCYLRVLPLEDALARYMRFLRKLTTKLGVPHKLHRTLTWGWLALLDSAMARHPSDSFDDLLLAEPALLDSDALLQFYTREQLSSEAARTHFVLPVRE